MRVSEVMSTPVVTVRADMTVHEAAKVLFTHDVTAAPVVGGTSPRLLGIVSEVDLLRGHVPPDPRAHALHVCAGGPPPRTVAQVMTQEVISVCPAADTADVAEVMARTGVKSVPVVEDGLVIGIISRRDLLRALTRDDDAVRDDVRARLRDWSDATTAWVVEVEDGMTTVTGSMEDWERQVVESLAYTVPGVVRVEVAAPRT